MGDVNPLDDDSIDDPSNVVIKVRLTTSSPTLSLSNPDPGNFCLILSLRIFHSPYAKKAITICRDGSAYSNPTNWNAFRLVCLTEEGKDLAVPSFGAQRNRQIPSTENKDLKEMRHFISIPASRPIEIEHAATLDQMLRNSRRRVDDLKPGMRYRVWMKDDFLHSRYSYWGDLEDELRGKKLSDGRAEGVDGDGEKYVGLESDGWVLRVAAGVDIRGNVGKHGPVFELVE